MRSHIGMNKGRCGKLGVVFDLKDLEILCPADLSWRIKHPLCKTCVRSVVATYDWLIRTRAWNADDYAEARDKLLALAGQPLGKED